MIYQKCIRKSYLEVIFGGPSVLMSCFYSGNRWAYVWTNMLYPRFSRRHLMRQVSGYIAPSAIYTRLLCSSKAYVWGSQQHPDSCSSSLIGCWLRILSIYQDVAFFKEALSSLELFPLATSFFDRGWNRVSASGVWCQAWEGQGLPNCN